MRCLLRFAGIVTDHIVLNNYPSISPLPQIPSAILFFNCLDRAKPRPPLLVYLLNRLTYWENVNDSLIDDEVSWLKYVEEVDETKSTWLVISATAVVLVGKDKFTLGVRDTPADISWDWLDTFEWIWDGEVLWVTFAMIFSDAGKDENKNWVSGVLNNLKDSAVVHPHYPYAANSHKLFHI